MSPETPAPQAEPETPEAALLRLGTAFLGFLASTIVASTVMMLLSQA
jgi:hypothetical protein